MVVEYKKRFNEFDSNNSPEGAWGTGAINEISARLREELPGLRAFQAEIKRRKAK